MVSLGIGTYSSKRGRGCQQDDQILQNTGIEVAVRCRRGSGLSAHAVISRPAVTTSSVNGVRVHSPVGILGLFPSTQWAASIAALAVAW